MGCVHVWRGCATEHAAAMARPGGGTVVGIGHSRPEAIVAQYRARSTTAGTCGVNAYALIVA